jgi:hypothetical protein
VLVLSVIAVVSVAIATYIRIRKKVDAVPVEEPGKQPDRVESIRE